MAAAAVAVEGNCGGNLNFWCKAAGSGFGGKAVEMAHGMIVVVVILLHSCDFLDFDFDFDKDDVVDDDEDSCEDPESEGGDFLLPAFDLENFFNLRTLKYLLLLLLQNLNFFSIHSSLQIPSPPTKENS